MVQYSLVFVALSDAAATFTWGGPADLSQEWVYGSLATITFNNPTTMVVDDDDAFFEDDDARSWGVHGIPGTQYQTVATDVGSISAGTFVEPEFWIDFTTTTGESYRGMAVSEIDAAGNIVGIIGFTFQAPMPPTDATLSLSASSSTDLPINNYSELAAPACFTPGTMIRTSMGDVDVETLKVGDLVETLDNGLQPVKLVAKTDYVFEPSSEKYKPVEIRAGSLGDELPCRDMWVSPQHRILAQDPANESQVLVAAKSLVDKQGVRIMKGKRSVTYIHLVMERHEVIFSDGILSESFFPGAQAFKSANKAFRRQLLELFPALASSEHERAVAPAREFMPVQKARKSQSDLVFPKPGAVARLPTAANSPVAQFPIRATDHSLSVMAAVSA